VAPLDRIKKKNDTTISIALMKMKPMPKDMPMQHDMNNMDKTPVKNAVPTKTAEPDDTSEDTVEGGMHPADTEPADSGSLAGELQALLNNVSEYYITAHQFHWNVVGPDFAEFHKFFNKIYNDAFESIDGLGESIRKMDQMVDIEFGQPDECENVQEMLHCLSDMNMELISQYKDTIDCANKYNEQGILNFLADRLDKHQMFQWQISSFLKSA
jgi:starvation-inducible DNA-binding protein